MSWCMPQEASKVSRHEEAWPRESRAERTVWLLTGESARANYQLTGIEAKESFVDTSLFG
jgi:hypothetical protein